MRKIVETQDAPTAQVLYNNVEEFIEELEADMQETDSLFFILGQIRAFLEENYEVE